MKWKALVACLILSLSIGWMLTFRQDATVVKLRLDPSSILGKIPNNFIGFGYETSAVALPGYFSAKNRPLVELYRSLCTTGLIRIGGNVSDHTKFVKDGQASARPQTEVTIINNAALHRLSGFLEATGWTVMWGLNLGTGSKEEAVEEALAVKAALGKHLQSFEIGNEVDLLPKYRGKYDLFHAAYLDYQAAIRKAIPDAAFSGPDVASDTEWCLKFSKAEAADLKLVTHHYYRTGAMKTDATIKDLLLKHESLEKKLRGLRQAKLDTGVSYRINETNSFYGGGKPGVSDTFASALWCLDFLHVLASNDCAGVNMQTDINHLAWVSHYSPIFRYESNRLTARPSYYAMLAFTTAANGDRFKLDASVSGINLTAYGTRAKEKGGELWVTLINKDLIRDAAVHVPLPDGYAKAVVLRLAAPGAESKDGVTFDGTAVAVDGKWVSADGESIAVKNGTVIVSVPKASAVLIRLTPGAR